MKSEHHARVPLTLHESTSQWVGVAQSCARDALADVLGDGIVNERGTKVSQVAFGKHRNNYAIEAAVS